MSDSAKILVVDDELGPRESLRMILSDRYEVITADSGPAALEVMSSSPASLVLLDIRMPGMDGIEALRQIKRISPETEVVMITAFASVDTAKEAMAYDVTEYLIKPPSVSDVKKAVERGLARRDERLGLKRELKTLRDHMRAMIRASTQVGSEQRLLPMLSAIVREGARVLGADHYGVCTLSERKDPEAELAPPVRILCGEVSRELMEATVEIGRDPKPWVVHSSEEEPLYTSVRDHMLREGYRSMALLPLLYGQEVLGAIALCHRSHRVYAQRDIELAQVLANQIAVVLKNSQLDEDLEKKAAELSQKVAQLSILREISAAVSSNLDLDAALNAMKKGLRELGYDDVGISAVEEEEKGRLRPEGPDPEAWTRRVRHEPSAEGFKITSPIALNGRPRLLLEVHTRGPVDPKELELMGMLSEHIAIAVRNSQLYKEISETKGYLESLINNAGDAIVVVGLGGQKASEDLITSWNSAAERIFGYTEAEILGRPIWDLIERREYEGRKSLVLTQGQAQDFEVEGRRKDGEKIELDFILSPIKGAGGEVVGLSAIIKDITERNELQRQLLHSEKQRALGIMSGGVAHNFNNILAGVLGYAEVLSMRIPRGEGEHKIHDSLEAIKKAALSGATIVRRMQEFARSDEKEAFTSVHLNEVVEESLSISKPKWKHEPEAKGIRIGIRTEFGQIPLIRGNASQLSEIVINLLFNAVEAMPRGGEISIRTWEERGTAFLSVLDTGIGMSQETKERVFDPFFTTKGIQGVGLGMSVVHGIIRRHDGQIEIDTEEGKGTSFTLRFPILEDAERKVCEETAPVRRIPARILFIEDEKDIQDIFSEMSQAAGHQVCLASSGSEGLKMLERGGFDAVFTDIGMPGMSGWQVAARAKEIAPEVPVVLCTGWSIDMGEEQMKERGVDFIVDKPFRMVDILDAVDKAVKGRKGQETGDRRQSSGVSSFLSPG